MNLQLKTENDIKTMCRNAVFPRIWRFPQLRITIYFINRNTTTKNRILYVE